MFICESASANPFKDICTALPKPDGGEFGKYYSLTALNDPRIGMINQYCRLSNSSILSFIEFKLTSFYLILIIADGSSSLFYILCFL